MADPVSQTRRVRVEIENPAAWPAGTQARVRLSGPPAGGIWPQPPEGAGTAGSHQSAVPRAPWERPAIKHPESFDLGRAPCAGREAFA